MPFDIQDYCEVITHVIKGGFLCTPRLRLIAGIHEIRERRKKGGRGRESAITIEVL